MKFIFFIKNFFLAAIFFITSREAAASLYYGSWHQVETANKLPAHIIGIAASPISNDFIALVSDDETSSYAIYFLDHENVFEGWNKKITTDSFPNLSVCSLTYELGCFVITASDLLNNNAAIVLSSLDDGLDIGNSWKKSLAQQQLPRTMVSLWMGANSDDDTAKLFFPVFELANNNFIAVGDDYFEKNFLSPGHDDTVAASARSHSQGQPNNPFYVGIGSDGTTYLKGFYSGN